MKVNLAIFLSIEQSTMVENKSEAVERAYTSPQVNPYSRVDEEVATVAEREDRRKKRLKCFMYVAAFVVFQTGIILIFALTVMKVRTPKFRVRSASFDTDTFNITTLNTNRSFHIKMIAELGVKNPNFGRYKYQDSSIEFYYMNIKVGEAFIPRARARPRSTRKFNVPVELSSVNVPRTLAAQFAASTVIPLSSQSRLRGKVELMKIIKKNKYTNMSCTMEIDTSSRQLRNLYCR
ncbi:late embryogenesis abundant protein At1g64065-like [Olea europaea var. sylvestris]|uniref:late embryogenesis abundant protein At1g64065-like n=1 Tax=Olea europaea var. sylvestris TaxID=158386 RepID=UPI000C1D0F58|nr:late embryogenesis abundant protein At1g64065-like [Olea europaea var. sylvestris]XP_022878806.1 late embryogenesis abundant protein At1g64065-like [Olea europaea var. sylvestris]